MGELLFFLLAFLSEVIGSMIGFGSSTIFLPLALFFVDFKTALVLVAFVHIFGNIGRVTFFRHGINKKLVILFGVPSVIFTIIGAYLVNYVSSEILKFVLGVFILIFSIASLLRPNLRFSPTKTNAIAGGGLSGFFAGLIGTGGALRGAFLNAFGLDKNIYIATAAVIALAVDATRIPIYFAGGFLAVNYYYYIPILFIFSMLGSYVGKKLVSKISQKTFRKLVFVALIIVSIKFIADGTVVYF